MESPKISIVIPSYNKVRFIGETLGSIFSQNYQNFEVIIEDGGSTDGTVEIIEKFAKKYPKQIWWESRKDKGQLDAVDRGMKKATGQILTYINADDSYEEHSLEIVARSFTSNPDALWFTGRGIVIDEKGKEIAKTVALYKNLFLAFNSYFFLLTFNYLMQPSVFFTKEAYEKYGPFSGTPDFIMEYGFWLKLGKISMPVVISKSISKFRIEQTTKTKNMSNELLSEDWRIVNKYTGNPIVLILHKLNNLGRILIGKYV